MTTPAEDFAAFMAGQLPTAQTYDPADAEQPGPRAPKANPAQGASGRAGPPQPDPATLFAAMIADAVRGGASDAWNVPAGLTAAETGQHVGWRQVTP
jgi:hypothetical protein